MLNSDFFIRPATPDDAIPLSALQARIFAATYGIMIPPLTLAAYLELTFAPEQVAMELHQHACPHLIAVYNGTMIGMSKLGAGTPAYHQLLGAVELARLYVDEAFHGRGVAGGLLQHTLATARERGYTTVWLCVWERNARAIAFYRKHGFMQFGRAPVFVDDVRFDDLLMRRNLHDC